MFRSLITALFAATLIGVPDQDPVIRRDEDATVRAVLDSYLAMVTHPDPGPIDAQILSPDIEAFWSTGETLAGRDAFTQAMAVGVAQIAADLESFQATPEGVKIRRKGNLAWLTCRIESRGKLTRDRGAVGYSVRSTFVLEKRGDRWLMVHEHSSRLPDPK